MYERKQTTRLTTDPSGSAEKFLPDSGHPLLRIGGAVLLIHCAGDLAEGADVVITIEETGEPVLTLTGLQGPGVWYPRNPIHNTQGSHAFLEDARPWDYIHLADDRLKISIANGGPQRSAIFTVVIR